MHNVACILCINLFLMACSEFVLSLTYLLPFKVLEVISFSCRDKYLIFGRIFIYQNKDIQFYCEGNLEKSLAIKIIKIAQESKFSLVWKNKLVIAEEVFFLKQICI